MAILNEKKVAANGLLSKIEIGGKVYEIKDVIAREAIDALSYISYTNIFANDAAIKEYVDSQVGSINKFDVVIGTAGANGEPNVAASADTMYKIYLIAGNPEAGSYIEWITIREGENYKWEAIGSTAVSLDGYITGEALNKELAKYTKTEDLGALAFADSATGTVAGQTISGVKATGTSTGSIKVELQATEKDIASTGKYTPAGNVTGTVATAGSIAVTAKYEGTEAVLAKGDYTPAGTVSANFSHATANAELVMSSHAPEGDVAVALSGNTFNAITGVGSQATFQEGAFTPASLTYDAVEKNVAKEGLVGAVDENECLVFTAAGLEAISASKVTDFSGGSKAADTFVPNSLPTMVEQNVGVQSATFTGKAHDCVTGVKYDKASLSELTFAGTKAEGALVTGVTYQKADIDTATFTGQTVDITATFAGTEGDVNVAGKANDYAVKTAEFNSAAIELNVGDITVAAKDVTVS